MRWPLGLIVAVGAAAAPAAAPAGDDGWRVAFGFYEFRWETDGPHGRQTDCRSQACDDQDSRRASLDSAMGVRLGAERPVWWGRGFEVLAGGELRLRIGVVVQP